MTRATCQPGPVATEHIKRVVCEDGYDLQYRRWSASQSPVATVVLLNGMMSQAGSGSLRTYSQEYGWT